MFLIERVAVKDAVLKQKSQYIHDGKRAWVTTPCKVFENRNARLGMDETGRTSYGHVFFVAPLAKDPALPAQIQLGDTVYDISEIKYYHNLAGDNCGYRMKVAGV